MPVRRLVFVAVLALAAAGLGGIGAPAGAADFGPVDASIPDGDPGSLRDVIENDATNVGGDIVVLQTGATYPLTCGAGGELAHDPATPLQIVGNGATITMDPTCDARVLVHEGDTDGLLHVDGVTITGGNITSGGDGGGVQSEGPVLVTNSRITDNHVSPGTSSGGAISAQAEIRITDSVISGNTSSGPGGGVRSLESITATRSSIVDNTGNTSGGSFTGAGLSTVHEVLVIDSTISGNVSPASDGEGGGIFTEGTATVVNSTITGNSVAGGQGGAISAEEVVLVYATIAGNAGVLTAQLWTADITSFGSVVVDPIGGANCPGGSASISGGYNFADDDSACGFNEATDRHGEGLDAQLGALADNGGPTMTLLPAATSPLVDWIPNAACQTAPYSVGITADQRGLARPEQAGGACDIGAVELQLAPEPPVGPPVVPPVVVTPRFTG